AALFAALRRRGDAHARRRLLKLAVIAVHVFGVGELVRRADGVAENLVGRRHLVGGGQVIDEFRQEVFLRRVLFDLGGVLFVQPLRRSRSARRFGLLLGGDLRGDGQGEQQRAGEQRGARPPVREPTSSMHSVLH